MQKTRGDWVERLLFSFLHACSTRDLFFPLHAWSLDFFQQAVCMRWLRLERLCAKDALGSFPLIFFKRPCYLRAWHTLHSIIHCSTDVNQEVQNLLNARCVTWFWLAGNAASSYSQSFSAGSYKVHIVQTKALSNRFHFRSDNRQQFKSITTNVSCPVKLWIQTCTSLAGQIGQEIGGF